MDSFNGPVPPELVQIRQFQERDLQSVRQLFREGFATYNDSLIYRRDEYISDILAKDLGDIQKWYLDVKGGNFWVAELTSEELTGHSKIIGCVGIQPLRQLISINSGIGVKETNNGGEVTSHELKRMFVDPSCHGTGLAQRLLGKVEDFVFNEQNGNKITLSTGSDMPKACRFYEKMGYELTRVENVMVSDYYSSGPNIALPVHFYEKRKIENGRNQ